MSPRIDEEGAYKTVAERGGGRHPRPPVVTRGRSSAF